MSRFFCGHPMIQWVVFEQYVPFFSGHPIIQWVFSTYIQQDQFGVHPSNHPMAYFSNICPVFFGSSNDPMGGFRTCPVFFGSSNDPMGLLNIYPTGPVWSSSIQPSNGLFFETMSRFFLGHPMIQWAVFEQYVPIFSGHPIIQCLFSTYIQQDQFGVHPSNHPMVYFSTLCPVFFWVIQ